MSDLPSGWEWTSVGEICHKPQYGWTTKSAADAQGLPYLRTTDITKGPIDWQRVPRCKEDPPDPAAFLLEHGDLVVSRAGSVGVSARVQSPPPSVFASYLIRLRVIPPVSSAYLQHFLKSPAYWRQISDAKVGIAVQNVNATKLAGITVPLPPLQEQERVVAAIDEHLSRLNAADQSFVRLPSRLERFRQVLLHEAFDGRWPRRPITDVTDPARVIRYGILKPGDHVPYGVPVVKVRDYPFGEIQAASLKRTAPAIAEQFKGATLRPGDVLISIRGTYGRVASVPDELNGANITQDSARIAPLPLMHRPFLVHFLRSPECQAFLQRVARGVAVKGVNIGDLRQLRVPVPDYEIQVRTAALLDDQLSLHAHLSREVDRAVRGSSGLRNSIVGTAFSGQLVPQDPSDEPASVLLDRIRADRAAAPPTNRARKTKTS